VTATAEFFGLRPVANAFGTSVGITATFGLGRSAWRQSRSTMSWSWGACSRVTTFAPEALSANLSEVKYCRSARPPTMNSIGISPKPVKRRRTRKKTT
jgi:hypothetical protein